MFLVRLNELFALGWGQLRRAVADGKTARFCRFGGLDWLRSLPWQLLEVFEAALLLVQQTFLALANQFLIPGIGLSSRMSRTHPTQAR
jgi:hypothetical protein